MSSIDHQARKTIRRPAGRPAEGAKCAPAGDRRRKIIDVACALGQPPRSVTSREMDSAHWTLVARLASAEYGSERASERLECLIGSLCAPARRWPMDTLDRLSKCRPIKQVAAVIFCCRWSGRIFSGHQFQLASRPAECEKSCPAATSLARQQISATSWGEKQDSLMSLRRWSSSSASRPRNSRARDTTSRPTN